MPICSSCGQENPFAWTAQLPLLEVATARGDAEAALDCARAMLGPKAQRLPERLTAALTDGDFAQALVLARADGCV